MKIAYLCTHNACRSILAEVITKQLAGDMLEVMSAGSEPAGKVNPLTLKYLADHQYQTEGLDSNGWEALENNMPDVVISVCDQAAGEACPVWFQDGVKVHWGLPDPTKATLTESERQTMFDYVVKTLKLRVEALINLPLGSMSKAELQKELSDLAELRYGDV